MNDRNRGRGRWSDERRYSSQRGGRRGDTANDWQRRETFGGSRSDRYMTDRDWSHEDRYQRDRGYGGPSGGGYREDRWQGGESYGGGEFRSEQGRRFGSREPYGSGRYDEGQYGQRQYG